MFDSVLTHFKLEITAFQHIKELRYSDYWMLKQIIGSLLKDGKNENSSIEHTYGLLLKRKKR